jgi:hypothetical protein
VPAFENASPKSGASAAALRKSASASPSSFSTSVRSASASIPVRQPSISRSLLVGERPQVVHQAADVVRLLVGAEVRDGLVGLGLGRLELVLEEEVARQLEPGLALGRIALGARAAGPGQRRHRGADQPETGRNSMQF